jgi:hypothetical protein
MRIAMSFKSAPASFFAAAAAANQTLVAGAIAAASSIHTLLGVNVVSDADGRLGSEVADLL